MYFYKDLIYCTFRYSTSTMELRMLLLSFIIGLMKCTGNMSIQNLPIFHTDSLAPEKLFSNTFNPLSSILSIDSLKIPTHFSPDKFVIFNLFTSSNPNHAYILKTGDINNMNSSPFNPNHTTKVIIHGWKDRSTNSWVSNFRKNYFMIGNYNIITVDWYPLSVNEYTIAAKLTRPIGIYVGELLHFLNTTTNLLLNDVHILGHSLGAHIAGFSGASVSSKIGRITGMDPAGPLFEMPFIKGPKDRLDPTDALFVDIIHTCAGSAGFSQAIGHIDFYPNGGSSPQPGCPTIQSLGCSHSRSYIFMIDSIIYQNEFVAVQCDTWNDYENGKCMGDSVTIMGENVDPMARGIYYLKTNSKSPYGKAY